MRIMRPVLLLIFVGLSVESAWTQSAVPFETDWNTVLLMHFDGNLQDSGPNVFPATFSDIDESHLPPVYVSGQNGFGQALSMTGDETNQEAILVQDNAISRDYPFPLTAECWINLSESLRRPSQNNNLGLLDLGAGRLNWVLILPSSGFPRSNLVVYHNDGSQPQPRTATTPLSGFTFDQWHHLALVVDLQADPTVQVFLDGLRLSNTSNSVDVQYARIAYPASLAGRPFPQAAPTQALEMFGGLLDEFRLSSINRFAQAQDGQAGQIAIPSVELMPNIPEPFDMRDWKALTVAYDEFVFNFDATGEFLPIPWWDTTRYNFPRDVIGLPSYVGHFGQTTTKAQAHEAITTMPAVLGPTLIGIDKSNQNGHNWVLMQENYYNIYTGENLVLNYSTGDSGQTFWYELWPHIMFYQLVSYYPGTGTMDEIMRTTANKWYTASYEMGGDSGIPNFDYTAFDFDTLSPVDNGRWKEPDSAAGIAWLEYMAYAKFGLPQYLTGADWGMQFLENRASNPFYEVMLPNGAYLAARMNAELGRNYNVEKLINWCFGPSVARPGWGIVTQRWGDYDCHGLVGSLTDGGGYAFAMNTFTTGAALVPLVRYDDRFARAIGKWMLNAANNARLFYSDYLPAEHQSSAFWTGDPGHVVCYEGLRKLWDGKSPYAMGDALLHGYGPVDFAPYGASYVGLFGGLISPTNEEKIIQLDLLVTDFFHGDAYPSYLYFNPYSVPKQIQIEVGPDSVDLYDAAGDRFLARNITNTAHFDLAGDSAAIVVVVPAGGQVSVEDNKLLIDNVVVDFNYPLFSVSNWEIY